MSGIAIAGNNSGSADVQIQAPAVNTPQQYDMPKHSGKVAAFGAPAAKALTGTAVDFINGSGDVVIPDDARRITVMFNGVSTNGTASLNIQLGSGSIQTTGYQSYAGYFANGAASAITSSTTGLHISGLSGVSIVNGAMRITRFSGNTWQADHVCGNSPSTIIHSGAGVVSLSGPLDRIRLTTVNGTDQFDAGTVAILVE